MEAVRGDKELQGLIAELYFEQHYKHRCGANRGRYGADRRARDMAAQRADAAGTPPAHTPARPNPVRRRDMPWFGESGASVGYRDVLQNFAGLRQQGLRLHYWP